MKLIIISYLVGAALAAQANCPGNALTNDERDTLTNAHNTIRSQIATGASPNMAGNLNAGQNMYMLKYDCALEEAAKNAMGGVCSQAMANPPVYGQNVQAYVTPSMVKIPKNDQLQDAVEQWYQPVAQYGLNGSEYKFTDPRLQSFANLAHYKSTALGCHYAKCQPPERVVIVCMYNNPIQPNETIYPKGFPCRTDADCTVYNPSTCNQALQLCMTTAQNPTTPTTTPPPQQNTMCQNPEMTDAVRKRIRAMHNWRRSQVALGQVQNGRNTYNCSTAANMYKMKYDCDLEKSALDYAKQCNMTPSPQANRQGQGENVHTGPQESDKVKAAATAVKAWWSQIFRNGVNQRMVFLQSLRDKPNAPTAFTQMAWALSTRIGCAVVDCQGQTFTVCRYKEEGNILNQQIYQVGQPCSACQTSCLGEGLCATP